MSLTDALRIYSRLLEKGEVRADTDRELFLAWRTDDDTRQLLDQFGSELRFKTIACQNAVYFVPDTEDCLFGMTAAEIQREMGSTARRIDVFLFFYIIMFILSRFYGGKNQGSPKQRLFLTLVDLIAELDAHFEQLLQTGHRTAGNSDIKLEEMEESLSVNFRQLIALWQSKLAFAETGRKHKMGVVLQVSRTLRDQGLMLLLDDRELRPTGRLDDLMINHYLREDRVMEMRDFFARIRAEVSEVIDDDLAEEED